MSAALTPAQERLLRTLVRSGGTYVHWETVAVARRLAARGLLRLEDNGVGPSPYGGMSSDERWRATITDAGRAALG